MITILNKLFWFIVIKVIWGQPSVKGIPINIGGRNLIIAPLLLGFFEENAAALNNANNHEAMAPENIDLAYKIIFASLKRNYKFLSYKWLVDNLDAKSMVEAMNAAMAGLTKSGEAPPVK